MTRCFLLLVLLGSSLPAKQLSFVHAFSPSSSSSAARPSLVGTAAATRRHRSVSTATMISINNNNNNNNNNAVEDNELFTSSSTTRRDTLLAAATATAAITTTWTIYPPLPAMAAAPAGVIIVVAGATGQTGRRILERLSKKGPTTVVVGGVRDIHRAQKSLSESSTIIRGAMIQQVNSINISTTNGGEGGKGGEGGGRLELKHLDVVKDTVDELTDTLTGASALIIATGFVPGNPLKMNVAAHEVDNVGTCKLIDAAKAAGITKVVMISSILANGRNWGQTNSPGFVITNAFGNVLDEKLVAENYLRNSGIPNWTIVRPGGLKSTPPSGALRISAEDTLNAGEVSRDYVADVVVAALTDDKATNKVLEIIENEEGTPPKAFNGLIM